MGIFLIIVIILILCWPLIRKWLQRVMANKAEDFIRQATGMPPRPGSRQERQQRRRASASRENNADEGSHFYSRRSRQGTRRHAPRHEGPIIPKEYAVDVEYTETKVFSETTIGDSPRRQQVYNESQVSDAEWVEIKTGSKR